MRRVKIIIVGLSTVLWSCQGSSELFSRTQVLMGDIAVQIQIQAPDKASDAAFRAMGRAFQVAREIEAMVSEHQSTSETSLINRSTPGRPVAIGQHMRHLLQRSLELSEISEGFFDISFASPAPSSTYRDIYLSPDGTVAGFRMPDMQIALSGIAKGYIVDQMSEWLLQNGWKNFLINAGGEIRSQGRSPSGPWIVEIHPPARQTSQPACTIQLQNWSIATSGLSERGQHIVQPHSKRPVIDRAISVSVLARDTETADALATAILAAGIQYRPLLERLIRAENKIVALVIDGSGQVTTFGRDPSHAEITCQPGASNSTAVRVQL